MNWSDLLLVAADAPLEVGVVFSRPVVSDGRLTFRLGDVSTERPVETERITTEDVRDLIASGVLQPLPQRSVLRNHLAIVQSRSFANMLDVIGQADDAAWETLQPCSRRFAYLSVADVVRWKERCTNHFAEWSARELGRYCRRGDADLGQVEDVLKEAIFVAEKSSATRYKLFLYLGLLLEESDPERLPIVIHQVSREFNTTAEAFIAGVFRLRADMKPEGRHARPEPGRKAAPSIFGTAAERTTNPIFVALG